MTQSEFQPNILVLNKNADIHITLSEICSMAGSVYSATDLNNARALIQSKQINVFITDSHFADHKNFTVMPPTTSVLITGDSDDDLRNSTETWPKEFYIDSQPVPFDKESRNTFLRKLNKAIHNSWIKNEQGRSPSTPQESFQNLKQAFSEISQIKEFIARKTIKELEKRIEAEAKYKWFLKEKQKIEAILKKLYSAADFNSLMEIINDAKELILARGISIYLLEESETQESFLKPVVWDDALLFPSDFSKHIVPIDSRDIAAVAGRKGESINVCFPSKEDDLTRRYNNLLKFPLKSLLCVPLLYQDKLIGVLEAYNKIEKPDSQAAGFKESDLEFIQLLSEHIAIAITKLNLIQYDALTSLMRPDPFFTTIIQKLRTDRKRRQQDSSYALVMGDLDWFKQYNDRNGHEAGNSLLMQLSQVLKKSIREDDLICRYGGEEFLFFLSKIEDIKEACRLTERIRRNVEEHYFKYQEYQPRNNITMSFGVTVFSREKLESVGEVTKASLKKIVHEADMAMAEAKSKKNSLLKVFSSRNKLPEKNRVHAYQSGRSSEAESVEIPSGGKKRFDKDRRQHERYPVSTMIVLQNTDSPQITNTLNLSLGGVKISTPSPLKLFDQMDMILILGEEEACQLHGDVIYSTKVENNGNRYYSGLKFRNISAGEKAKLERYVAGLSQKPEGFH